MQRLVALLLTIAGLAAHGAGVALPSAEPGSPTVGGQVTQALLTVPQSSLPSNVSPALSDATSDKPAIYANGCHSQPGKSKARVCTYGDKGSSTRVLLFGDSHAASWQPALDEIGKQRHWRILTLTKAACPIPRVEVAVRGKVAPDCTRWRKNAMARIGDIHPDLVVATSFDHVYTIPGKTGTAFDTAWRTGMTRTLKALRDTADHVVLLGDTPLWTQEAPVCLRRHPEDIERCATRRSKAVSRSKIANDRRAASAAHVAFADTTSITCLADPCPVVWEGFLLLRDDLHMTATWSHHLWSDLLPLLPDPAS